MVMKIMMVATECVKRNFTLACAIASVSDKQNYEKSITASPTHPCNT